MYHAECACMSSAYLNIARNKLPQRINRMVTNDFVSQQQANYKCVHVATATVIQQAYNLAYQFSLT